MSNLGGLDGNFSFFEEDSELESRETIDNKIYAQKDRRIEMLNILKKEKLQEVMKGLPEKNISYHLVSNGTYDFFTHIPLMVEYMGGKIDEYYGSTWTMNRANAKTILEMYDNETVKKIRVITGLYFKRRESAVYALLLSGLLERGQKFKCFKNHSKISLLGDYQNNNFIVIEGSANYTANPRVEQFVINNDKKLYEFHKNWMDNYIND